MLAYRSRNLTCIPVCFVRAHSLDDDIRVHLPDVPDFGSTITIRHLLHHTSGLRDWVQSLVIAGDMMDDVISFKHILKMARHQKTLNFEPGAEFLYSNTGYNLLAEIVERVTGDSFREWTDTHIFKPLDMTNSHFHDDHQMILKNRAYSYQAVENGGFKHAVNNTTALGSSSLYSTVEDLAKWILNFDNIQIGEQTVIEQMHQRGVLNDGEQIDYALGLNIGEYRGLKTVGHSGSWRGFRSHLIRFPDQKFGVVILCNLDTFNPLSLAEKVADLYLADILAPVKTAEREKHRHLMRVLDLNRCHQNSWQNSWEIIIPKNSIQPTAFVYAEMGLWHNTDDTTT